MTGRNHAYWAYLRVTYMDHETVLNTERNRFITSSRTSSSLRARGRSGSGIVASGLPTTNSSNEEAGASGNTIMTRERRAAQALLAAAPPAQELMAAEANYATATTAVDSAVNVDDVFDSDLSLSPRAESEEPSDGGSPSSSSPASPIPSWTPPLRRHARRPSTTLTRTRSLPETNSVLGRRVADTAMPLTGSPLRRTSAPTLAPELLTQQLVDATAAASASSAATSSRAEESSAANIMCAAAEPTTAVASGSLPPPLATAASSGADSRRCSQVAMLSDTLAKASIDSGLGDDCHLRPVTQHVDTRSLQAGSASPRRRRVTFDPMVIGRELNRALQQLMNPRLPASRRAHLQTLVKDLQRELEAAAAESRSRRSLTASPCSSSGRGREGSESGSDCFDLVSEEEAFDDEDDEDEDEGDEAEDADEADSEDGNSSSDEDVGVHHL